MIIINRVDFSQLISSLEQSFRTYLEGKRLNKIKDQLMKNFKQLVDANFLCYQANMIVIAERKKEKVDNQLIADMEWQARTVGERRVNAKAVINALVNSVYPVPDGLNAVQETWMSDDIVYSIGEMIDRLTIEQIKREDYQARLKEETINGSTIASKIKQSQLWTERVKRYLDLKLQEISRKGYYECIEETRTYDLGGISDRRKE